MCNCINLWPLTYLFFIQIDCYLYIHTGNSSGSINETCGPKRHMVDVHWLFIVCYKRKSTKSYPKRHMRYYGRWWCGFCITVCGKRQWFGWKFTSINAVLENFLQSLQYCLKSQHECPPPQPFQMKKKKKKNLNFSSKKKGIIRLSWEIFSSWYNIAYLKQ